MGIAILDARVAKLVAQDPAWKEVLVDAPQRGVDAYFLAAKQYTAELVHSNQFELAYSAGAKNQIAGCETGLRADFMHVFGTHATEEEAIAALSEPIASLLFTRLVACEKATSESVFAESLGRLHDRDDDERALPRHEARAELLAAHLGRGARAADRIARRGQGLLGSVRAQSRARPRSRHRRSPCHRQRHRHGVVEH